MSMNSGDDEISTDVWSDFLEEEGLEHPAVGELRRCAAIGMAHEFIRDTDSASERDLLDLAYGIDRFLREGWIYDLDEDGE